MYHLIVSCDNQLNIEWIIRAWKRIFMIEYPIIKLFILFKSGFFLFMKISFYALCNFFKIWLLLFVKNKTIIKIMWIKYLLKLKYYKSKISKIIFYIWLFCFDHNLKNDDDVLLISKINRGLHVVYSWMISLND